MFKRLHLNLALSLIMGVVLLLSPFLSLNANAVSNPCIVISQVDSSNQDVTLIKNTVDDVNESLFNSLGLAEFLGYSYSNKTITIELDNTVYRNLSQENKQELMSICLNGIQNSKISTTNRNKIYNFIADTDATVASLVRQLSDDVVADFAGAYAYFKPFTSPISIFLGVLTILIFVLLGLSIVVDIAWLVIPGFQWLLMRSSESTKPPLISIEAYNAYKECESGSNTSRTPLGIFFKMKTKEFLVLGVCLLYLISGHLYTLVGIVIDYLQGLLPS